MLYFIVLFCLLIINESTNKFSFSYLKFFRLPGSTLGKPNVGRQRIQAHNIEAIIPSHQAPTHLGSDGVISILKVIQTLSILKSIFTLQIRNLLSTYSDVPTESKSTYIDNMTPPNP